MPEKDLVVDLVVVYHINSVFNEDGEEGLSRVAEWIGKTKLNPKTMFSISSSMFSKHTAQLSIRGTIKESKLQRFTDIILNARCFGTTTDARWRYANTSEWNDL